MALLSGFGNVNVYSTPDQLRQLDPVPKKMQKPQKGNKGAVVIQQELARRKAIQPRKPEEPRGAPDPAKVFQAGLRYLEKKMVTEAILTFAEAYKHSPGNARYASYYGLSLALSGKRLLEAQSLCSRAVEKEFYSPDLCYNLGRVCLLRRDRGGAYRAFKKGLMVDKHNKELQSAIARLGRRQDPVFRFLRRNHVLNKYAGLVRKRFGARD